MLLIPFKAMRGLITNMVWLKECIICNKESTGPGEGFGAILGFVIMYHVALSVVR